MCECGAKYKDVSHGHDNAFSLPDPAESESEKEKNNVSNKEK